MEVKRPTWKSTTFILVVVTQLLNVLGAVTQYLTPKEAAIAFTILTSVFAGCNAWIKVNTPITPVEPPKP